MQGRRLYDIHDVIHDVKKYLWPWRTVIHGIGSKITRVEYGWVWPRPRQAWLTFKTWWHDGRLLDWRKGEK